MAEALAAVGGVASLVQLADASIRICLCLFTFFSTLNNLQPEFDHHVLVIKDVHDSVQIMRKTITGQMLTEVEKKALSDHLGSLTQELSSLKKSTAGKDPAKLRVKIACILKSAETDRTLQRLENHKTSLMILLQALNLSHSEKILSSQTSVQAHIQCLVQQQKKDGAAMRSNLGKVSGELRNSMRTLDTVFDLYQQSLEDGFSIMSREVRVSQEQVGNAVRNELLRQLRPLAEELFTKSEIQNTALLEQLRAVVDDAATKFWKHRATEGDQKEEFTARDTSPTPDLHFSTDAGQHDRDSMMVRPAMHKTHTGGLETAPASLTRASRPCRSMVVTNHWAMIRHVGAFRVEYSTQTGLSGQFCTFKIDFWPSNIFLGRRGLSLKYSSRPDGQGYIALCPSIATRSIICEEDPIWDIIENDDIENVIERFRGGNNGPFDQNDHGTSLLMHAAKSGSYKITQFLLHQGADPTQTTVCGRNSFNALLAQEITMTAVFHPFLASGRVLEARNFELFCAIFHSMVAVGCDLEDCQDTMFHYLVCPQYSSTPLNYPGEDEEEDGSWESDSQTGSESMDHSSAQSQCGDTDEEDQGELYDSDNKQYASLDQDYLAGVHRLARFLTHQGLDLSLSDGRQAYDALVFAERATPPVFQPHVMNITCPDPDTHSMRSIIYSSLSNIHASSDVDFIKSVVSLISVGADIYYVK